MVLAERPTDTVLPVRGRGRGVVLAGLACVVLAALSLLYPSSPTYDPWAWIVWGREILHLDLSTSTGPSWKPLPVLFTTPFALFGPDVAPALWLVVARAGALAAIAMAFAVARRLSGSVAGGAAAAGALVLAPWFLRTCALGNSEGLLVACVLGAAHRLSQGPPSLAAKPEHRQAFALGVGAALLRPEAWPFLGVYALWLVWRDRTQLRMVAVGLGLLPVLWLLPELWGSGNLLRAADRAKTPRADSPAFADDPVRQVLDNAVHMLTWPIWAGLALALAWALAGRGGRHGRHAAALLAALSVAWLAVVAYMTNRGFSGNQRYLIMPVALAAVLAGAGAGWTARALLEAAPRRATGGLAAGLAVLAVALFALPSVDPLGGTLDNVRYQGELPHELARAVDAAGGAARLRRCGDAYAGAFFVPAVAWQLHVHTSQVALEPAAPAVVFLVPPNPGAPVEPSLATLGATPLRTLSSVGHWRLVAACRSMTAYP